MDENLNIVSLVSKRLICRREAKAEAILKKVLNFDKYKI
jgi:hypothetical protein